MLQHPAAARHAPWRPPQMPPSMADDDTPRARPAPPLLPITDAALRTLRDDGALLQFEAIGDEGDMTLHALDLLGGPDEPVRYVLVDDDGTPCRFAAMPEMERFIRMLETDSGKDPAEMTEDEWVRDRIRMALEDPRPPIPQEQVLREGLERIEKIRKLHERRRKG